MESYGKDFAAELGGYMLYKEAERRVEVFQNPLRT
jgi:hypothetical protein